jgi:hypothetical protein
MTETYALVACFILAGLTIFQIALILGAPLGRYAWGGQHTILPRKLKISSLSSLLVYAAFAVIILSKAGVADIIESQSFLSIMTWILAGYFWLGVVMNGISRSKPERNLMTPVALVLATLTTIIALS